jgi:Family of unknown function (DUF6786)
LNLPGLIETLDAVGKPPVVWESCDGTRVLVLPYGGRVLGVFAPRDDRNFFWTHPALGDVASAREFYGSEQWHNSGGERTWLAPEVDFFFPDFPDLNQYWQQPELDPGHYEVSQENAELAWTNRATLNMSRTKRRVEVEITKSLAPALNPLGYDSDEAEPKVKYAGYTLRTSLQLMNSGGPVQIGLWQLVQMPHGGEMLVPTFFRGEPKVYFGAIGADDLVVDTHLIRYKMRADGGHKIGVPATAVTGRAGYLYGAGDEVSLVVRNFTVDPSGEYIDVPWAETEKFGFAFQACNVNVGVGAFSELEYHLPAIGLSPGSLRSEDESQLWAFRGPWPAIKSIAQRLLSEHFEQKATLPS